MSRIIWFTLGAVAGMAYASSAIKKERLDLAIGETRHETGVTTQAKATQLADTIEAKAAMLSETILEKGHMAAEKVRSLRKEKASTPEIVVTPNPMATQPIDSARTATPHIITSPFAPEPGIEAGRHPF